MAFTLSAATTINGIANSYIVTGSGNLDDLATATASIGMTRTDKRLQFAPNVARILAISGTLTEERTGVWDIDVSLQGHICWAYGAGAVTTLGKKDASGAYTSCVNINYHATALTLGTDPYNGVTGKCLVGQGAFTHVCGSILYDQAARSDLCLLLSGTGLGTVTFDNVVICLNTAVVHYSTIGGARLVTTAKTALLTSPSPHHYYSFGTGAITIKPIYTDAGVRMLSQGAGQITRIEQPLNSAADNYLSNATSELRIIDPQTNYSGPVVLTIPWTTCPGLKKIYRTLYATFTDNLGASITNATPKLITLDPVAGAASTNLVSNKAMFEALQSTRLNGVSHLVDGTGYTDSSAYSFWLVGYGYTANYLNVPVKTVHAGNSGIVWTANSQLNPLAAAVAYSSVVTAPFSLNTTGDGTLTISANCTTDQIGQFLIKHAYDNASTAFWRGLNHQGGVVNGVYCDVGGINIVVNTGVTVSEGTTTTELKTTNSVTLNGTGQIAAIYTSSAGTSTTWQFQGVTVGTSLVVYDASGVTKFFQQEVTTAGTYNYYIPPGATGTYYYAIEQYGKKREEGNFPANSGGILFYVPSYAEEVGISETTKATVAAYTAIDNLDKLYDYTAYKRLSESIIKLGQIATRNGSAIDFGDVAFDVDKTASTVWNYDSVNKKLIVKANIFGKGSTMNEARTNSLMTASNGATISIPFEDSLGLRGTVLGLDPKSLGGSWYLRYRLQGATTWTEMSGTGNSAAVLLASGIYDIEAAANGYDRKATTLDTTLSLSIDMSLSTQLAADETPQYLKAFDSAISNIFNFDTATGTVIVTNTTGDIIMPSYAEMYRAVDRIMNDPALVWSFTNPVKTNSVAQAITIPNGNPLEMVLSANSNASVQLTCSIVLASTGALAYSRIKGNASGYQIILGSPGDATSAGLKNSIVTELKAILGGAGYNETKHSLIDIKTTLDEVQTSVDSLGI